MSKEDIARVALGAPALHEVFIVSTPDCLLVRSWARSGRFNTEDTAVHLGSLFRASQDLLVAVGSSPRPTTITVEADQHLVLLSNVSPDIVAGFVFDKSAPLGLARVQSKQLTDHIRASVNQLQDPAEPALFPAPKLEPQRSPTPITPPSAALSTHVPARNMDTETPALGVPKVMRPKIEAHSRQAILRSDQRLELPPTDLRAELRPPIELRPVEPKSEPRVEPKMFDPPSSPPRRSFPEPATTVSAPPPSIPGLTPKPMARPRAVRLLEFYKRYAPDPQAALHRLSLRTGLSIERLERPEDLDEAQVETIATAVRDILGQEQVGL
jgi:predicted regulator of Ras-like GTPase activity (Roadblock/LC7/MglB family)